MLIHRDVELNPDAVVEEFSRRYPRRLLLINPFSEYLAQRLYLLPSILSCLGTISL